MKVKDESEKAGLKCHIQETKIMASGPITSWQIVGEVMETVTDLIFRGSKITEDGDSGHEIERCWFLGRKIMINLNSILKSRDITLPTKVHLVKVKWSRSVMCDSQRPHGLQPTRLLRPWDFPGKSTRVGRLVITFLPRSKRLLISWLQSPSAVILEPRRISQPLFPLFPIYVPLSDGTRCHDFSFLNVEL